MLFRSGSLVLWRDVKQTLFLLHNADLAVNPSVSTLTPLLPHTSRVALVMASGQLGGGSGNSTRMAFLAGVGGSVDCADVRVAAASGETAYANFEGFIRADNTTGEFEAYRDNFTGAGGGPTFSARIYQRGYVEDTHATAF